MPGQDTLPSESDIVIIGGGIMGTSTAFFLSKETDLDITLVEKNQIGTGSTGDSSAILRHHYGDQEIYSKMAWWSHQFYRNFDEETGEVIAHEDNPMVRFANGDTQGGAYAEAGYDVLSELDIPVSRHEGDELLEEYPMISGVEDFDFGISDDEAAYSDGADAANGFDRAARRNGVTVITGTGVESINTDDGAVVGVETEDGEIACEEVVVAAGPWTPRLGETVDVDIPITVTREQVLILDPPKDYKREYPSLVPTTALPGGEWYIRPDFGDGILVATHHTGEEVDPDRYDNTPDEEILLELTEELGEMIPDLREAGIQGQYCGVYSTTPDHDFILDEVGPDGCYFACGFSGHGFKQAPAVGKIMSDLITTGSTSLVDGSFFSYDRFAESAAGHGDVADNI
ncbi:NAD(P)/FAD-dependent oxidoreductase [Halobacterium sp. KA-6]|uniref:NAD(P)/FAD-dependent oxidoreductase n=1 Tax=Halobacterium sp. KA-6 TaxID=2896368 RepID=UPI001E370620|nr:FAD-dependent oxidoreductase [Halobacterium sp. KA-6]MCD2205111.1 FAD-binding oxidoreductase [Halobacterium sp. KA-6]